MVARPHVDVDVCVCAWTTQRITPGRMDSETYMMKRHVYIALSVITLLLPSLCAAQMDKALHAGAGFGITITVSAATNKPKIGLLAGIGAGVGKELWDANRPGHTASANDCLAAVGASAGAYALWKYVLNRHRPVKIAVADPAEHPVTPVPAAPSVGSAVAPPAATPAGKPSVPAAVVVPGGGQ
jgi:uncharacterized protein YfiM (DUF2279 family)